MLSTVHCPVQRRTGVKDTDISDFERKVSDVEKAIKGMMDGSIKPEDVRVEGIESEEEKLQKQVLYGRNIS